MGKITHAVEVASSDIEVQQKARSVVPIHDDVQSKLPEHKTTETQELLIELLPSIFLLDRTYRFTFSSLASDTGLLVVGLIGLLILNYFFLKRIALSVQFKVFLISCGSLFLASGFSLLQMHAADKERHKLNAPLFVISQLHFTISTLAFSVWHLLLIGDLNCCHHLQKRGSISFGAPVDLSRRPSKSKRLNARLCCYVTTPWTKLQLGVVIYLVVLALSTLAWRISLLKSRWAVCIFSRLANAQCLCFLLFFSYLLIRVLWRRPLSSIAPLLALMGNLFGIVVLLVSIIYVGTQEAPLGRLWVCIMLLLYFATSLRLAWPLRQRIDQLTSKSASISNYPVYSNTLNIQKHGSLTGHKLKGSIHRYHISNTSVSSGSSLTTVGSSILRVGAYDDAVQNNPYRGPIPQICIHPNTSAICASDRPNTARTDCSQATSYISNDSDLNYAASVEVHGASFGLKSSEPARLIRLVSSAQQNTSTKLPIIIGNDTPSSPISNSSIDNDEREFLSRKMQEKSRQNPQTMKSSISRPRSAHQSRFNRRLSFTSPSPCSISPQHFAIRSANDHLRPATADAVLKTSVTAKAF